MRWFRNHELRIFFILSACVSAAAILLCFFYAPESVWIIASVCVLFMAMEYFFARRRYQRISALSEYLKSVNSGHYDLSVQDHVEGELSILKSEIYKATVMLCAQTDALKKEKSELADALSDISHQLKTPLTSMLVMTDLLCDPNLPDDKRIEFTDRIRAQLERIEWLVTSLLKLSKLDAGTVTFNKAPVSLQVLLQKVTDPLQIPIEIRRQTLQIDSADITLLCDMNWTAEALLNILKNCVEHTPAGGSLTILCKKNPLFTQITLSDNGTGIDPSDLPHIFDRFFRGKNASADSVGIGLAMAKSIITSQGGNITVDSKLGHGTTFNIQFFESSDDFVTK